MCTQDAIEATRSGHSWQLPMGMPTIRNGWVVLGLSLLTIGIYAVFWIFRLQREHPRRAGIDPPAGIWLGVFAAFTCLMFSALLASGFGGWTHWEAATADQREMFALGMFAAVLFNVWFGFGAIRLTDRFSLLLRGRLSRAQDGLTRLALLFGIALEMVAMLTPYSAASGWWHWSRARHRRWKWLATWVRAACWPGA